MLGFGEKDSAVAAPNAGSGEGAPDLSALREEIGQARKTRADKGRPRGKRSVGVGGAGEITQEEVDALFEAENWEALACLPFETRYVMTGYPGFRLSEDERTRMAKTTATTMKVLLKIDPKYIALAVWGTMYFGTWAAKEAAYASDKAKLLAVRKAQQGQVGGGSPDPARHPNAA